MGRKPRVDAPHRIWAIGDVHGCVAELDRLLDTVAPSADDELIFLGDYIDRGPHSAGVVQRLIRLAREVPGCVFLRGNHEDMFLGFLGLGGRYGDSFRTNGGEATLRSYGLADKDARQVAERLPAEHVAFFTGLRASYVTGNFFCAHAGVDPWRGLDEQRDEDLMWIRDDFLRQRASLPRTVVHGHSPGKEVVVDLPYRIGLDTGLVYGNRLSGLDLTSGDLVQVRSTTRAVEHHRIDLRPAERPPA